MPTSLGEPSTHDGAKCPMSKDDVQETKMNEKGKPWTRMAIKLDEVGTKTLYEFVTLIESGRLHEAAAGLDGKNDIETSEVCGLASQNPHQQNSATGEASVPHEKEVDDTLSLVIDTEKLVGYIVHSLHSVCAVANNRRELAPNVHHIKKPGDLVALIKAAIDAQRDFLNAKAEESRSIPDSEEKGDEKGDHIDNLDAKEKAGTNLGQPFLDAAASTKRAPQQSSKHIEAQSSSSEAQSTDKEVVRAPAFFERLDESPSNFRDCLWTLFRIKYKLIAELHPTPQSRNSAQRDLDDAGYGHLGPLLQIVCQLKLEEWKAVFLRFIEDLTAEFAESSVILSVKVDICNLVSQLDDKPWENAGYKKAGEEETELPGNQTTQETAQETMPAKKGKARKRKPRHKRA